MRAGLFNRGARLGENGRGGQKQRDHADEESAHGTSHEGRGGGATLHGNCDVYKLLNQPFYPVQARPAVPEAWPRPWARSARAEVAPASSRPPAPASALS